MKRSLVPVVLALTVVSLSGCGTVCNFVCAVFPPEKDPEGWPRVYGGLEFDNMMGKAWDEYTHAQQQTPAQKEQFGRAVGMALFALAEGTASLVGDTLTLPITIPLDMVRRPEKYAKKRQPVYNGPPQYSFPEHVDVPSRDAPLPSEPGRP